MKFIDEISIKIQAGRGGNGIVSFRREAHIPHGGPNGGDGGNGGNIYFVGDSSINTLLNLRNLNVIKGNNGENGRSKDMHGANGENKYINVPYGTIVIDNNKKTIIANVIDSNKYLIARGGNGGKGNARFKSSQNSAPKICDNGTFGDIIDARLELQLLANVGLIGLPSAGKSTLLSRLSNAKPKIANYDFTTLVPQLGLVKTNDNSFVIADLPGLIKGASIGKGLGHQFLRHIKRCSIIAHIIDMGSENKDPIISYENIRNELKQFSNELFLKKEIIIANKNDLPGFKKNYEKFSKKYKNLKILPISSLLNKNFLKIKDILYSEYLKEKPVITPINTEVTIEFKDEIIIDDSKKGIFVVSGNMIEKIYQKIPLNSNDNIIRFKHKLKLIGLWDILRKKNIKPNDEVVIFNYKFKWESL